MLRIHIIGDRSSNHEEKVRQIAASILAKDDGNSVFTIVKKPGVNMQMIEHLQDSFLHLTVCGVDAESPFPLTNYVNMSLPAKEKTGRHNTFDSISELNEYLTRKAVRIFALGEQPFLARMEEFINNLNETLPKISHKKLVKVVLE